MPSRFIPGFSKLSKEEKLRIISSELEDKKHFYQDIESLNHSDPEMQSRLEKFSENTLGNFPLPYGIAPNFLINNKFYTVPMVTEESSVVAAASAAAKFWSENGGFHAEIKGTVKIGQLHFCWFGEKSYLLESMDKLKSFLLKNTLHITKSMKERGGGVTGIELLDFTDRLDKYYQLRVSFLTSESMGANFINSVLEEMALLMKEYFSGEGKQESLEIIMSILSNYTPDCLVECHVEAGLKAFEPFTGTGKEKEFARRFKMAVDIAGIDTYRAVTHNKGIFNGIDAVALATANDFRAVEAAGHAYAARSGSYSSLSSVDLTDRAFRMKLELPLAIGTVGGLTRLHPIAKWSYEILNKPNAEELMMIIASAGLASNFAAVRSLVTSGIQKGHMKMHLVNILSSLNASASDQKKAIEHFKEHRVTYHEVKEYLASLKNSQ